MQGKKEKAAKKPKDKAAPEPAELTQEEIDALTGDALLPGPMNGGARKDGDGEGDDDAARN